LVVTVDPPATGGSTDGDVISASLAEPEKFAEVFHRHWDEIHRYIIRRLGLEVAEDVAAETFTVAFRNRRRYDQGRPDARPWLYGIATNLIRQHRKTERRRAQVIAQTDVEWFTESFDQRSDERVTAQRLVPRIASVPGRLSPTERDLLLLIAWADMTYEGAAQALDLPLGTVRSRLHRIHKKFRRAFGDLDPLQYSEETHE
jgi:RNA polymerase sigma-70 factor (ECF subfamily)